MILSKSPSTRQDPHETTLSSYDMIRQKETKEQVLLASKKRRIYLETFNNVLDLHPPETAHTQTHTPCDACWPGLPVCIHFPHGAIRQRWSTQVMERLGTQSAQVEDLCAAIFTPELQSMTDIQPDASLKAQTPRRPKHQELPLFQ